MMVSVGREEVSAVSTVSVGIKLGAVGYKLEDAILYGRTPDHVDVAWFCEWSPDDQKKIWKLDVTEYFNSNFGSGTSQTCNVAVRLGDTVSALNATVTLYVEYEYDDAVQDPDYYLINGVQAKAKADHVDHVSLESPEILTTYDVKSGGIGERIIDY
jgi:hypothetical protein